MKPLDIHKTFSKLNNKIFKNYKMFNSCLVSPESDTIERIIFGHRTCWGNFAIELVQFITVSHGIMFLNYFPEEPSESFTKNNYELKDIIANYKTDPYGQYWFNLGELYDYDLKCRLTSRINIHKLYFCNVKTIMDNDLLSNTEKENYYDFFQSILNALLFRIKPINFSSIYTKI